MLKLNLSPQKFLAFAVILATALGEAVGQGLIPAAYVGYVVGFTTLVSALAKHEAK